MEELKIRKLQESEAPPLELLLLADPSEKMVKSYINKGQCYVAEINQEVVGVFVLLPTSPQAVEIVNVAVSEDKQGQGIGKRLVEHAIYTTRETEYKSLEIGTGNSSIGQLALYQKCGFRITGIDKDYFTRNYEEDIFENGIQCRDMIRLSLYLD
jgi:ribosomal protein S18 acetylase RimI-like enzyme